MTSLTINAEWCVDRPDAFKTLHFYMGPTSDSALEHGLVLQSYSPAQFGLDEGKKSEIECEGMRTFKDLSIALNSELSHSMQGDSLLDPVEHAPNETLYPCGLRALASIQRRIGL